MNGIIKPCGIIFVTTRNAFMTTPYVDTVCVRNGSVYALVLDKHFKEEKKEYETFMQQALANSKYKYIVHLYTDTDAFAKKIHSIGEPNDKTKLIDQYMREQILTFCV